MFLIFRNRFRFVIYNIFGIMIFLLYEFYFFYFFVIIFLIWEWGNFFVLVYVRFEIFLNKWVFIFILFWKNILRMYKLKWILIFELYVIILGYSFKVEFIIVV